MAHHTTRAVAAFDFDGTITTRDSLLPFIYTVHGPWITALGMVRLIPSLIRYALGLADRKDLKEKMLRLFFGGWHRQRIEQAGRDYAASRLEALVRPEARRAIAQHLKQGDRCLLVSASVSVYLVPWAEAYGFERVLCSELEFDRNGCVTGKLRGANCREVEKVRRLEDYLGPKEGYYLVAYGDSRGDKEMLEIADKAIYRPFRGQKPS